MLRRKYGKYLASNLALIISVFWLVQIYEDHLTDHLLKQNDPEALDAYRKASFSNLEMYWNVVLGFFMTGANTGIRRYTSRCATNSEWRRSSARTFRPKWIT